MAGTGSPRASGGARRPAWSRVPFLADVNFKPALAICAQMPHPVGCVSPLPRGPAPRRRACGGHFAYGASASPAAARGSRLAARVGPKPHAPFQTKTGAIPSRTASAPRAPGAARTRPLPRRLCRNEFARTEFVGKRCAVAPARRRTGKRRRRVRRGGRARRRGRGPALAKPAFGRTDVPRRAAVSRVAARRALILQ